MVNRTRMMLQFEFLILTSSRFDGRRSSIVAIACFSNRETVRLETFTVEEQCFFFGGGIIPLNSEQK